MKLVSFLKQYPNPWNEYLNLCRTSFIGFLLSAFTACKLNSFSSFFCFSLLISSSLFEDNDKREYNNMRILGDIYICIPRMKEQAVSYGHSETREIAFLGCHGLLHLLGYDHMKKEDEEIMFKKQEMILDGFKQTRRNK